MKRSCLLGVLIALSLVIVLSAMACGGGTTTTTGAAPTTATSAAANTETTAGGTETTAAATDTTAPAGPATGDPIKLGVIAPLTGVSAGPGADWDKGVKTMIDMVNKAGGINGRPLETIVYDSKSETEQATAAATRLIQDDKVFGIVGPMNQWEQTAVRIISEQSKVVSVSMGATTLKDQAAKNNFTWSVANLMDSNVAGAGAVTFIKEMGWKSVVGIADVITVNQETNGVIADAAAANGFAFVNMPDIIQFTTTDFQPVVNRIKEEVEKANADALCLQLNPYALGPILSGLSALGVNLPAFCGTTSGASPAIFDTAGPEAVEGMYVLDNAGNANPEQLPDSYPLKKQQLEFRNAYNALFGSVPTEFAAMGAGQVVVMAEALRQAKDVTSEESVREALVNLTNVLAVDGIVTFTPDSTDVGMHNPPVVFQCKNGTFEFIKILE